MNKIKINGTQNFMGIDIPIVEGGFGENCRVVTGKVISDIHNIRLSDINASINRLIDKNRIKKGIDYINILSETVSLRDFAKELGMLSSNRTKDAFILSERGYAKLIKAMDDDKSWDIMDKFIDEYFTMRQTINSNEQLKAKLLLSIYNGGQEGILASKELTKIEVATATAPLLQKIEEDKPYTEFAKHVTESSDTVDVGEFAKIVKNEHIIIGRNRLFEWLRKNKYLMSNNTPYQKYIENKYFEVVETTKETAYGTKVFTKTLITGKGQVALVEKLRKEFGVAA